ncbi:hypothetical protein HYPSUDRAFT_61648 [Hypholoma sublateritium FD-334 SS-4]|uniref:Carboxylic ester hydrolase n=1 Tax=Hypholoma sublateritium (strain FD-334 SS-4) TaxID=945553 RepID=A0A0D2PK91_HYPSF|nr:hypothetical protein HYPSUDRAFT_61648 [Hypholoma sublateritium FD-334 SS-4]
MRNLGSIFAILSLAHAAQDVGLTVLTQQGAVAGTQVLPTVRQFLGIPFATAQRWQAPQLPPLRGNTLQAINFSDGCLQNLSPNNAEYLMLNGNGGINAPAGEDCLFVNIWAPSTKRRQDTAVLIWVYGGTFAFGTSGVPVFNGTNMIRDNDDIILVTFNYRLNIFGQPNAPQLSPQNNVNSGLLDVEAAIQWVHANIANFGGDPNRITISGQSAGGIAVDAYTFSHPNDTIVKGMPQQGSKKSVVSGTVGGIILTNTPNNFTDWNGVASAVGCGSAATTQQFTCMQKTSARTLEQAVMSTGAAFNLVIDNTTIPADTQTRATNGDFLRVPLLVGSTAHEEDIFVVARQLSTSGIGYTIPAITEIYSDAATGFVGTCPSNRTAMLRLNANVPTFRYQYQGIFRSLSTRPDLRAYHSSEIPMIFGTYNDTVINGATVPATLDQVALSKYMQSAWVAFARDPEGGLPKIGWPTYDPSTATLAQLGNFFNTSGVVFGQSAWIDAVCSHPDVLGGIVVQIAPLLDG